MVDTVEGQAEGSPREGGPRRGGRADAAVIGRRVALALYVLLAVWVMGSGLVSVVPQIFWPARPAQHAVADCGPEIESLAVSLEEITALRPEPLRRERFAAWDTRYLAIAEACEREPSYSTLYRARYAAATAADRHDDELAPLLDEVRARARASGDR